MVDAAPLQSWDFWLRDVVAYVASGDPYRQALTVVDQLQYARDQQQIDEGAYTFGELLLDSVLLGYCNIPGIQCQRVSGPCFACVRCEPCERWKVWRRLYPHNIEADRKRRMCAFLLVHVPRFGPVAAERVGVYVPQVFGV